MGRAAGLEIPGVLAFWFLHFSWSFLQVRFYTVASAPCQIMCCPQSIASGDSLLSSLPSLVPRQPHPPSITIPVQTCSGRGTDVAFVARARASSSQSSGLLQYLWHRGPFLPLFKEQVGQESLGESSSRTGDAAVTRERAPRGAHRGGRPGAQQNWVQREELEQQGLLLWPLSAQQHPQGTGMIQNLLGK